MAGELILIIEDNDKNRKLARDVLEFQGFRTIESTTGEGGVALAREQSPALILLDIHLPDIDGIETLGRLRSDPETAGIPVIAVTASAMPDDRMQIKQAGFDRYLSKPINVQSFIATVKEVLAGTGEPC